ncbi:hypothetical protein FA09DRAFT_358194 [Tilletiopsis washingtonensis]|uniref:Uncharacterized protein n=1 Tax=Tilletiopsis washingtonensis TaxID=58919 RepID=A0A316ZH71_9BASI|nr:hypothetical protein FA09DRAFT_358194 [Tilletiopsis washingtonensis]PWO00840.1 hypothetical protein FA09DRAFT_358194 [Tilletiopsis washingtonensis]
MSSAGAASASAPATAPAAAAAAASLSPAASAAPAPAPRFDNGAGASCRLAEILQWDCTLLPNEQFSCARMERVFRICAGRPAVEVTHVVELDDKERVVLPKRFQNAVPRSHHWKELRRNGL